MTSRPQECTRSPFLPVPQCLHLALLRVPDASFNVVLEEKGGKKEFNNVQLWRLREGGRGWGVLGSGRDRFRGCVEPGTAQARTAVSSTRTQEELTLAGPVRENRPPRRLPPPPSCTS